MRAEEMRKTMGRQQVSDKNVESIFITLPEMIED
ncbi:MAG: hypothetical protein ACI8T1_005203 [Verrucomicrobiales bacterium]|jgi:hypothetical protein